MFLVVFVEASPWGSLFLHLIDCAPIALPQELPRRLVLLGAPLLLQQGTGNGRDLLIIRDEPLWAKAWCQWTVKELHFLQDSRPLRFPKRYSLGGSCMCYLPGNNFFGPFYHTKKSLTIKFYRYTVVVYLPKKNMSKNTWEIPGPPKGSRGVLLQRLVIFRLTNCHHCRGEGAKPDPRGEHDPTNEVLKRSQPTSF